MSEPQYFNAPVELLQGFILDKRKCLNDFLDYHLYAHMEEKLFKENLKAFSDTADYFNVTLGDKEKSFENGNNLYSSISPNDPKAGIKIDVFWQFYKEEKTDFEKACFLAFTALKSIIGSKPYCKATNVYLLSRMDGRAKSVKDVLDLSKEIRFFAKRYQLDKIKEELQDNWGLKYYSYYTRGFYVSLNLTLEKLIFEAEKRRESYKKKQRLKVKSEARKTVLNKLKR